MSQIVNASGFVPDSFDPNVPCLSEGAGGAAVLLPVEAEPQGLVPLFGRLRLIVLPFETSADGRAFSRAAELRALGYRGHLRGRGHVLVDQFRAALAAGFDDLEISDEQAARNPSEQWRAVPLRPGYRAHLFAAPASKELA